MSKATEQENTQTNTTGQSYRNVLKSTSLIGGASIINILISMMRTKIVAVLLGPNGVGLLGMYGQITGLVGSVTGMGIGNSGVRQVAEAVGTNNQDRIARTVKTLRHTAWFTGGLGLIMMVAFCVPLSRMTFGSDDHALPIAVLGITLLSGAVAGGQGCIINGTRRIGDLARISVISAINGTIISIPCFYLWGQNGIVPSLILSAFAGLATSWWYARRVPVKAITLPWSDCYSEVRKLLLLGISFMGAGLVTALSGYLIRVVLLRQFSLADVGIYQSAYNLSGILVSFVLGAMGSDYYPRLTAVSGDNETVHRMVNEQSQISIMLALPGLAAMMIFAPLIIKLFYSASFTPAVPILRWCILGILGRVFSWPMGFVMLAKGNGKVFFITEVFGAAIHLAAVFFLIRLVGLNGSGIAFMLVYVIYTGLMLFTMQRMVGAAWNRDTLKLTLMASVVMVILMLNNSKNNNQIVSWAINAFVLVGVTWFCLKQLARQSDFGMQVLMAKIKQLF